jgi:hypothetical protein
VCQAGIGNGVCGRYWERGVCQAGIGNGVCGRYWERGVWQVLGMGGGAGQVVPATDFAQSINDERRANRGGSAKRSTRTIHTHLWQLFACEAQLSKVEGPHSAPPQQQQQQLEHLRLLQRLRSLRVHDLHWVA